VPCGRDVPVAYYKDDICPFRTRRGRRVHDVLSQGEHLQVT